MAQDDNDFEVEEIEVAGKIIDKDGNEWAVPSGNLSDLDDLVAPDAARIPNQDGRFHYQWVRRDEVPSYNTVGWRPVSRSEVGLMEPLTKEYGTPVASYLEAGGMVAMKIPREYRTRRLELAAEEADAVRSQLEPTEKMKQAAMASGHPAMSNVNKRISERLTQ